MEESQNFFRLQKLLFGEGTQILRKIFRQRYQQVKNKEWENSDKSSSEFLESFSQSSNCLTIQRNMLKEKDLNKFDLCLLSNLIFYMDGPLAKLKGKLKYENLAIAELVKSRNEVAHLAGISVNTDSFEKLWEKIGKTLVRLGVTKESINKIYNSTEVEGLETLEKELADLKITVWGGDLARGRGDYDTAISNYSSALLSLHLAEEERLCILMNRSEALFESIFGTASLPSENEVNEKCQRALVDVEDIIRGDPKFCKAFLMAGKIHQCTKSWKSAVDMFDQALALNPGLPEALKLRNECRHEISKVEESFHPNSQTITTDMEDIDVAIRETEAILDEKDKLLDDPDENKRASACYFFGNSCEKGIGVKLDYEMALKYYKEAINLGCTQSTCALGCMYIEGRGTLDIEKGVELIERAANTKLEDGGLDQTFNGSKVRGVASAQFHLGECFEKGSGKPEDSALAAKWFKMASSNGSGEAAYKLGKIWYDERYSCGDENYEKARQYWRLAASRGNDQSMVWLASMYLENLNPDLAEQWFTESLKRGNVCATRNQGEFQSRLAEQRRAIMECKKTKVNFTPEDIAEKLLELEPTPSTDQDVQHLPCFWDQITEIQKRALASHAIAQNILYAMKCFVKGRDALDVYNVFNSEKDETHELEILENLASAFRRQDCVALLLKKDQVRNLRKISCAHMTKTNEKSNVDLNGRVCYTWIVYCEGKIKFLPFLEVCRKKYTEEEIFPKYLVIILISQGKYEEAMDIANQTLKIFPKNSGILYHKAQLIKDLAVSGIGKYSFKDIIKAYKNFIASKPIDDRAIAEVYYDMAYFTCIITRDKYNSYKDMERYYQQGLEAENKLLPCIPPLEKSLTKKFCEIMMQKKNDNPQFHIPTVATYPKVSASNNTATNIQLMNPHRIESVVRFRKMLETKDSSTNLRSDESLQPKFKPMGPQNLNNFVEMTFSDIITTKDHLYKGRFISLTATEDPKTLKGNIYIIAKDKCNDVLSIVFKGLAEATVKDQLSFGSKFSIINPFFLCKRADGIQVISVDTPEDIFVDSKVNKSIICRFCWRENPEHSCAKCKRVKYCSRECQVNDWKLLMHKLVCNP